MSVGPPSSEEPQAAFEVLEPSEVFTVRPDGKGYRRKTRFVACGNYLPADEIGDLYAAGADATTLRAILAYAAGKPWVAGTTDIRQASVLAPWKGEPVAVMPPKIAIDMGLCEPDEVWFVDKALYGLRESPKLWGDFRDAELRQARWEVEGVEYCLALARQSIHPPDGRVRERGQHPRFHPSLRG